MRSVLHIDMNACYASIECLYDPSIRNRQVAVGGDVDARFDTDGRIMPLSITWEDGRVYGIDRVLDMRRAASLKAGGAGTRYTVRIGRSETYLFNEDGRWFVERRES